MQSLILFSFFFQSNILLFSHSPFKSSYSLLSSISDPSTHFPSNDGVNYTKRQKPTSSITYNNDRFEHFKGTAYEGGGIYAIGSSTVLTITNCTFQNVSSSQHGGAVYYWEIKSQETTKTFFINTTADYSFGAFDQYNNTDGYLFSNNSFTNCTTGTGSLDDSGVG